VAGTVRALARLADRVEADAVMGWMSKGQVYGGLAALVSGRPASWFQLGLPADVHWLDRLATLVPARVVVVCSRAGANAQAALWPHRPTAVAHPGTNVQHFAPPPDLDRTALRRSLGMDPDAPAVVIVGRLQRWKGMHVFIDSMKHVAQAFPNVQGVIVGGKHDLEPDYPGDLRAQIDDLRLGDTVRMVGHQTNVREWMQAADVVVHASDREPFGIVVIEALASGRPVVASDTAGPTEVIRDGIHGLLTPYGDAEALAHAIERYLGTPAFAQAVAARGMQRAQDFSTQTYAERVTAVLHEHTGSPVVRPPSPPVPATS
jgi:glycosyltransferase involved in cell wall biosynthesis